MNAAQHACRILETWRLSDRLNLEGVLDRAFVACADPGPLSCLESERQELLGSIIEHMRVVNSNSSLPEYSIGSGARALLSHLSADCNRKEESDTNAKLPSTKILNFGTELATCFTEVECRPRAYAG